MRVCFPGHGELGRSRMVFLQLCVRACAANTPNGDDRNKIIGGKKEGGWKIEFSGEKPATPLLDTVNYPVHMKNLSTQVSHGVLS